MNVQYFNVSFFPTCNSFIPPKNKYLLWRTYYVGMVVSTEDIMVTEIRQSLILQGILSPIV